MTDLETKVHPTSRKWWWRPKGVVMVFMQCLLVYGALLLLAYLFQDRLIYLPDRISLKQATQEARGAGLQPWPENSEAYRGLIPINRPQAVRGTVMVFHGNAGDASDRLYYVEALQRLGYRAILVEYPGYGARSGKPGEAALVADGRKTVALALAEFGRPLYVWGESLGCGVACAVAADQNLAVDGAILLTPWDCLPSTAQAHYRFLPARWLVRDSYDNIMNLRHFPGPVAVLMADHDEIIPNRLTTRLYQSISATKRLWVFPNAGHNSWPIAPTSSWWDEVMKFVAAGNTARL
jgi:uncharacterized protein